MPAPSSTDETSTRVAIISLLFNWPSTGGGTVHTAEAARFLFEAGYDVRHFYAVLPDGLGNVSEPLLAPSEALRFTPDQWSVEGIEQRFRAALRSFEPDWVIVTDSWNSKPILAAAARYYKFFLHCRPGMPLSAEQRAAPCASGQSRLLPRHQLATPDLCCQCVFHNGRSSGGLHKAEREMVGYGTEEYYKRLRWAFAQAKRSSLSIR